MTKVIPVLRLLLALAMMAVGVLHFVQPAPFVAIVPQMLPAPLALVLISGAAEIAGGLGLLIPRFRRAAGWGLVLLYLAVFPANINMAINHIQPLPSQPPPPEWFLWARLPLQAVLIWLALSVSRPTPQTAENPTAK